MHQVPSFPLAHLTVYAALSLTGHCNRLLMVDLGGDYGGGGDQTTFGSPELPQGRTMQGAPYDTTNFKKTDKPF